MHTNSTKNALIPAGTDELTPKADLTLRVLEGLDFQGIDARQSLLNGSLIRACRFRNSDLSRCDLEQVKIQDCSFVGIDFSNVELNSARIDTSRFERCNFNDALLSDGVWQECAFEDCSFKKAAVHGSKFERCDLKRNNLQGASVQLNKFLQSSFEEMTLGDCTFLNQLMVDCRYVRVRINAESIGTIFGISERDLLGLGLVYLGQPVVSVAAAKGLLDGLEKEYSSRRWRFMLEVLRLNFRKESVVVGLLSCFEALIWPATFDMPIKAADVSFFEMIILELLRRQELSGLTVLAIPDRINDFLKATRKSGSDSNRDSVLTQLTGRLRIILIEMLQKLRMTLEIFVDDLKDRSIIAKFLFKTKPTVDVPGFMNSLGSTSGLHLENPTVLLREASGSYVIVLETTMLTLAALQMALWLLNGCVAQITELKARLRIVSQKRLPKVIKERALLPEQDIPKWIGVAVQSIYSKLSGDSAQLGRLASDLSPSNLKRIEIQDKKPL